MNPQLVKFLFDFILIGTALYFCIFTIINTITFHTDKPEGPMQNQEELLSILIAARDEEKNLPNLLHSLIDQDYKNIEIFICNDNSSDKTWEIIQSFEKQYDFIHGVQGKTPLPPEWRGKAYALHQILSLAKGKYVLTIDADVVCSDIGLTCPLRYLTDHNCDMLSIYGYHKSHKNLLELCAVQDVSFASTVYLPQLWTRSKWVPLGFAIGQYMLYKRSSLIGIGGYERFKGYVNEDIAIGSFFGKGREYRSAFIDGVDFISGYMYSNLKEANRALTRSIGEVFRYNPLGLTLGPLFFLFFRVLPPIQLIYLCIKPNDFLWPYIIAVSLSFVSAIFHTRLRRAPWFFPFFYWIMDFFTAFGMMQAFWAYVTGSGTMWKGRKITSN